MARDGSRYIAGYTSSTDLPSTRRAHQASSAGGYDAFVARFDPKGRLAYLTYLGGTGDDVALGIDIDARGAAYVVGYTSSQDFPTTPGAAQPLFGGGSTDAFAVKLSPDGSRLEYATFLGGGGDDFGYIGPVDRAGRVHVSGFTDSGDFPVSGGAFQTVPGGATDAFVARLSGDGTRFLYSTLVGGSGDDQGWDGSIDEEGNVYLDGFTTSLDFPVTPGAFQPALSGGTDVFVLKLSRDGSRLVWASYLGGTGDEYVSDLSLDRKGNVHVSGSTSSTDFPTTPGAMQPAHGGGLEDGFLVRIHRSGTRLSYSTYVGGSGDEFVGGVRASDSGEMVIHGASDSTDLATTPDALQPGNAGALDLFVMKLRADGTLAYSTYLGGSDVEYAWGAGSDLDARGNYHFAGMTCSADFPVTRDAFQGEPGGSCDAFSTVIHLAEP